MQCMGHVNPIQKKKNFSIIFTKDVTFRKYKNPSMDHLTLLNNLVTCHYIHCIYTNFVLLFFDHKLYKIATNANTFLLPILYRAPCFDMIFKTK